MPTATILWLLRLILPWFQQHLGHLLGAEFEIDGSALFGMPEGDGLAIDPFVPGPLEQMELGLRLVEGDLEVAVFVELPGMAPGAEDLAFVEIEVVCLNFA